MRLIIVLLLFSSLTGYSQSKKNKKLKNDEIFENALSQYLKSFSKDKTIDTVFIELNDTLNFKLPLNIRGTIVKIMTFDSLLTHLRNKPNPHYFQITRWPNNNKVDIVLFEVSIQYSDDETVAITDSKIHRVTYLKTKDNLLIFKKAEEDNNGCRYFRKVSKDGHYSLQSICV